jgi:hypothetical protein
VPTVASSTDVLRRDLADLRSHVGFRAASVRGPSRLRLRIALVVLLAVTVATALLPPLAADAGSATADDRWRDLLPLGLTVFLLMAAGASVGTGGGRELVAREQAYPFPISPATDHFGALLMAPLNIAWLLQVWTLLGVTGYVAGPVGVASAWPLVLLWAMLATALGQVAGWAMEVVRREPAGVLASRAILAATGLVALALAATGTADEALALVPTREIVDTAVDPGATWPFVAIVLALLTVAVVLAGIPVATAALRRPPREEQRLETGLHPARPLVTGPADRWGDLRMVLRIDRASVLRSVPMRRGLLVLALLPGLGGLAAGMTWPSLALLPGLVAAAVALLFGVNAWALDGRGALWRESLPADPGLAFAARSVVLAELTVLTATVAVLLAGLRAGLPDRTELVAVATALAVVTLQVVATSARWSVRKPFAMDLRSARAVPAPPTTMLGYSARLALGTTCTGMVFSAAAQAPSWVASPIVAVPLLMWSAVRLLRARRAWCRPAVRATVVTTVAA